MKRKVRRVGFVVSGVALLFAGLLLAYLTFFRPPSWPHNAIHVPRDVSTLGEALSRVEPGGTIVLNEEVLPLHDPVRIEVPGITIAGAGSGARLVWEDTTPALSIVADGVVVQDVQITAEGVGILLEASGCQLKGIAVQGATSGIQLLGARDCRLTDIEIRDGQVGLELVTSDGNVLEALTVTSMNEAGIRILGSWENRIAQTRIVGAPVGLRLDQGAAANTLSEIEVDGAANVAIVVSASNDNAILRSTISASTVGVAVSQSTGTVVQQCQIQGAETLGVSLLQALQNRIEQNTITGCQEAGIRLVESGENALLSNYVSQAEGTGILLDHSSKNLLHGNEVRRVSVGLWLDVAKANRILRNTVAACSDAGIILLRGDENRVLDNVIAESPIGLLADEGVKNTVLRNRMEEHAEAAILVGSEESQIRVLDNEIGRNGLGLLISGSARAEILGNSLSENPVGLLLISPSSGLRIEANLFEANGTGIELAGEPIELLSEVEDRWGIRTWDENVQYAAPVLTNNTFAESATLDIRTTETLPVYAAGNWWGVDAVRDAASAHVSAGVDLQESAWVGTLALGTESDTAQILLGRILQLVLEDAGYRVIDLIGMGNGPRMQHALRSGDVDLVWWTGPEEEPATWIIEPIPASEGWIPVVGDSLASKLADPSMTSLAVWFAAEGERWRVAAPVSLGADALEGFLRSYGLNEAIEAVSWTQTLEEAETLLKFGASDLVVVGSLEETLTRSGFVQLDDGLNALKFGEIAAVMRTRLANDSPELREIIHRLGTRLTSDVLHDLMGRIRLMHMTPLAVAAEFLEQEGLVAQ